MTCQNCQLGRHEACRIRGCSCPCGAASTRGLSRPKAAPRPVVPDVFIGPRPAQAKCCSAQRDASGRYPIGFCSPTCERRHPVPVAS